MKSKYTFLIFVVALSLSLMTNAQTRKIQAAEEDYEDFSYIESSAELLALVKDGNSSQALLTKLANSYYFTNNMEDAAAWYGKLVEKYKDLDAELVFRYAMALKGIGNYDQANTQLKRYMELRPDDLRTKAYLADRDYLATIKDLSQPDLSIENLAINSKFSDFGTSETQGKIVFASTRGPGKNYNWNNQNFLDLYSAKRDASGSYSNVKSFNRKVNSQLHESTAAFTKDSTTMFFTRNNYFKENFRKDDLGVNRLQLYRATRNNKGNWDDVRPVHFNSSAYSVAHPTLNADETKLYFASDMPGTLGDADIWVVDVKEDYNLGTPVNLGDSFNTEGAESFPFINADGDLYFSSKGLPGLGGFDVFVSRGVDGKVKAGDLSGFSYENMGEPLNSRADDFGYYENLESRRAYFTSNREGGQGDDDIYTFIIPDCELMVNGTVVNKDNGEIIAGATVRITDANGQMIQDLVSDEAGRFSYATACADGEFLASGSKETYEDGEEVFQTVARSRVALELALSLTPVPVEEPKPEPAAVGTDLFKLLNLNPIYFDFDKSNIRPDAEAELAKVIAYLQEYPSVKIDVRSHTDSRGNDAYNKRLSQRRNVSTKNYIIERGGIAPDRISGRGYGETQLVNRCYNLIKCEDWEHQQNRRSEFIVVSN